MNDETRWPSLAAALRRELPQHFPEWTDSNDNDPGVTLLDLFAWLTERLLYGSTLDPRRIAAAQRLASAASIETKADHEAPHRVNYFVGQVLTADDFRDEQAYFRKRLRRSNLQSIGVGVVSGLAVEVKGGRNASDIEIAPGFAIDPTGEEIVVASPVTLALPSAMKEIYVQLRWVERPCKPIPATDTSESTQYTRILDTWESVLSPIAAKDAVTVAHLKRTAGRWQVSKTKKRRR